ncbi:hypothetical protein [Salegentibacter salegens]|uniref:Tellurite resistance protein TerB n=1 Tax=Salegentibacter salegens TaxID=143223 RepID=A0A1M7L760_9FLAO|nr:hypothetical protein [Salegentibacter salegens]PRX42190.1 hypothetical protein LY58_02816 [Salegentibacter salegens]SHM73957.1 hypothetical protein SAMN05878281_1779 [Salegentibacter salegens]
MKKEKYHWSKEELRAYILLLSAKADAIVAKEELDLIKSMTTVQTFKKMYAEFRDDDEDQALEKIRDSIQDNDYSYGDILIMRKEIEEVFASDGTTLLKESNLERILDNMLY